MKRLRRNRVRIIAGQWRGRCIHIPDDPGVRPTPDRVRETLFNWLQPWISGAECLDLFAGCGALGMEALSRGARHVTFIEQSPDVARAIENNLKQLDAGTRALVERADVTRYLRTAARACDIVFLDPPYHQGYVASCCELLERGGWLKPGGLVYIEAEHELEPLPIPANWSVKRSKRAGQVGYHLVQGPVVA
jgi:16S rRNA (guanine966-N2)-methyltransferase